MRKWPTVPAAYGWLSLNARGQWRYHPNGDLSGIPQGEAIQHQGLIDFFNRNYTCNAHGAWYVQNGPQKAYVALPYAPLILFYNGATGQLTSHHHRIIRRIDHWYLSTDGDLYANTDLGPALICDRDLTELLDQVRVMPVKPSAIPVRPLSAATPITPKQTTQITQSTAGESFNESHYSALLRDETLLWHLPSVTTAHYSAPCLIFEKEKAETVLGFVAYPTATP